MASEDECFTVVFKGSLRNIEGNPLTLKTPFGEPLAVGIGDAFKRLEKLETAPAFIRSQQ